jgi:hypothetical protein
MNRLDVTHSVRLEAGSVFSFLHHATILHYNWLRNTDNEAAMHTMPCACCSLSRRRDHVENTDHREKYANKCFTRCLCRVIAMLPTACHTVSSSPANTTYR